ncbi:MAG: maltose alpha-D-glucosyltransferase [Anaerolineaceae bacterium]|nr:maltose alpha-D-glucosyltransferase [Anaerolineaceae bacterium]
MEKPYWYKNAVFYEVYIRAFADGNADGHGDFLGLSEKIDYFVDLGVDCIWLSPMYPSPLFDDGYDIADFYNIHPDYGTLEDFKTFLDKAHQAGIRVIADLVLNHTSEKHPWFLAAQSDRKSPYRDYYVWSDSNKKYKDTRIIFLDTEKSNWTWDEKAGQYYWHRFYAEQPDLNFDNPAVQKEMFKIIQFWLDLGLDGFRADAVPYLFEREGTNCENLPETHAYLKEIRSFINENYPDRILLAEANQWPQDLLPYFGNGKDEFHMSFHFPLMPRIYMALCKGDTQSLVNILEATPNIPEPCQWINFLRNHDELTLEMVTEEERQWMWQEYAPEERMRLNLGIRRRLAPLLNNDPDKIRLANSLLFTLPGSPIIYYGDEIGMGDNIWLDDRDGVRTPMQWNSKPNAGFSKSTGELYAPVIDDPEFGYTKINLQAARNDPESLWYTLQKMISIRKDHLVFGFGEFQIIQLDNPTIFALKRTYQNEKLFAIHNLSAMKQSVEINQEVLGRNEFNNLLGKEQFQLQNNETFLINLEPLDFRWFYSTNK